jgi:hypothetical protein
LGERGIAKLHLRIIFIGLYEHADAPHAVPLLRPRRERPRRRAAETRDECAASKASPPVLGGPIAAQ